MLSSTKLTTAQWRADGAEPVRHALVGILAALAGTMPEDLMQPASGPTLLAGQHAEGSIGTLVITDTLTGVRSAQPVTTLATADGQVVYSTGDVVTRDGRVMQARIGEVVVRVVSGTLWTILVRIGTQAG